MISYVLFVCLDILLFLCWLVQVKDPGLLTFDACLLPWSYITIYTKFFLSLQKPFFCLFVFEVGKPYLLEHKSYSFVLGAHIWKTLDATALTQGSQMQSMLCLLSSLFFPFSLDLILFFSLSVTKNISIETNYFSEQKACVTGQFLFFIKAYWA